MSDTAAHQMCASIVSQAKLVEHQKFERDRDAMPTAVGRPFLSAKARVSRRGERVDQKRSLLECDCPGCPGQAGHNRCRVLSTINLAQ